MPDNLPRPITEMPDDDAENAIEGAIKPEGEDEDEEFEFSEDGMEPIGEIEVEVVDTSFGANLAEQIDSRLVEEIGSDRVYQYNMLKGAREQWEERIKTGIKWLGLNTSGEGNTEVAGACTAVHPLLMENIVKFQAKAMSELWPAKGPVRTKVKGVSSVKTEEAASRVRTYMNYQMTEQVTGFYSDLERNLFRVGFMGVGIRKAGWNVATGAPDPAIVYVENFFVDPAVAHLKDAEEHIEVMELAARRMDNLFKSGTFCDYGDADPEETLVPNDISDAITDAQGFSMQLERKGYTVGESHCYLDLQGEDRLLPQGGTAPYIVHFNVKTGKVYAIRRNWRENDEARTKRLWYTSDHFIPAFGFYSLGYVHLIGDLTAASSAALRALVDAGQYANWTAGFKSQDAKLSESSSPLGFGEFRDVNLSPEELQKAFLPLPAKEPSQTLMALLQFMVQAGQKFADATDEVVQNGTNYGPAATTLALLEASQRFYSAIHKRLHQSQGEFFELIGELNYENLPPVVNFAVGSENQFVHRDDFDPKTVHIMPASDPNALSETQRIAKAQLELDMAARFPQLHDVKECLRRFYAAMGTENVDKILVDPEEKAVTADPLTEIQTAMTGKPIKARLGQNHLAHITVKEAFLKSPKMQGANDPTLVVGVNLLKANIAEHKTLIFVAQTMQLANQHGLPLEDENVQAQLATQLIQMSAESGQSAESAEQKMLELQQKELELAARRIASQDAREAALLANKNRELDLKQFSLLKDMELKDKKMRLDSAAKVLDNSTKMAQNDLRRLSSRADEPMPEV